MKIKMEFFSIQVPESYLQTQAESPSLWDVHAAVGQSRGLQTVAHGTPRILEVSWRLPHGRASVTTVQTDTSESNTSASAWAGSFLFEFIFVVHIRFLCKKGITHLHLTVKNFHLAPPTSSYDLKQMKQRAAKGVPGTLLFGGRVEAVGAGVSGRKWTSHYLCLPTIQGSSLLWPSIGPRVRRCAFKVLVLPLPRVSHLLNRDNNTRVLRGPNKRKL